MKKLRDFYTYVLGIPHLGANVKFKAVEKLIKKSNFCLKTILDAGCGMGKYTLWLGEKFPNARVYACDIDEKIISKLSLGKSYQNVEFFVGDITTLKYEQKFDLILCIDVLELVNKDEKAVRNFFRALKRGGYCILHVPKYPWDYSHLLTPEKYEKILRNADQEGRARPGYSLEQIKNLLEKHGFEIVSFQRTFRYFGSLASELSVPFYYTFRHRIFQILYALIFPFLVLVAELDVFSSPEKGNGILVLALKP